MINEYYTTNVKNLNKYLNWETDKDGQKWWKLDNSIYADYGYDDNFLRNYTDLTDDEIQEYDGYVEDWDYDACLEFLENKLTDEELKKYWKWVERTQPEETDNLEPSSRNTFISSEIFRNKWCIHFSDDAYSIATNGFDPNYGINNWKNLSYSRGGDGGPLFFAYLCDKIPYDCDKYGEDAVMFIASGVYTDHPGDEETQAIFDGRTVRNLVYIAKNNEYGIWEVYANIRKKGAVNAVYSDGDIENVVHWVENNYSSYRKSITSMEKDKYGMKNVEFYEGGWKNGR